jgi:hypothetical protein
MNAWIVILLNVAMLLSWMYLLYQVFTIDPEVQAEWKGTMPSWAENYKSMIFSVKVTGVINGSIALLSVLMGIYKLLTPEEILGGKRRR